MEKDFLITRKKKVFKHFIRVGVSIISAGLMVSPAMATDPANAAGQVAASEGTKKALNAALTGAKSKPAMTAATTIVCLACIPVSGAAASPALCIACGILFAKTFN